MKKAILILILLSGFLIPDTIINGSLTAQEFHRGRHHHGEFWPHHRHRHGVGTWRWFPRPHARQMVYVCSDFNTKLYHRILSCPKLNNCKGEIITVTKKEAKLNGKRKCPYCY